MCIIQPLNVNEKSMQHQQQAKSNELTRLDYKNIFDSHLLMSLDIQSNNPIILKNLYRQNFFKICETIVTCIDYLPDDSHAQIDKKITQNLYLYSWLESVKVNFCKVPRYYIFQYFQTILRIHHVDINRRNFLNVYKMRSMLNNSGCQFQIEHVFQN